MIFNVTRNITLTIPVEAQTQEEAEKEFFCLCNDLDDDLNSLELNYPVVIEKDTIETKCLEVDKVSLKADRRYDELQDGEK